MKNKILEAEVLVNEEIASGIYYMSMVTEEEAVSAAYPGQFLNVYPEPGGRLILPRPFGICGADPSKKTIDIVYEVVGAGTAWMSGLKKGHWLKIAAPLGKGFDLSGLKDLQEKSGQPVVLVGGGVGCGPMLFLAQMLQKEELPVAAVLGFRDAPFLHLHFEEAGCRTLVASQTIQENTCHGTVIDCMKANEVKASAYFACGPRGMLAAVDDYAAADCGDEYLQVSLEERMGCGYGVCVGCSTEIRFRDGQGGIQTVRRKICTDGPVFRGSEVIWNGGA